MQISSLFGKPDAIMRALPDPRKCAPQLHFACQQRPPSLETIQQLVDQHPLSVEVRGEDEWLPIHRVCRREPSVAVVRCLVKAWPEGVNHWTGDGVKELGARLAIHLACQHGASLEVVKFLVTVQPETLEVPCLDHSLTPLDYAYQCWELYHLPQTRAVIAWLEPSVPFFQRIPRPSLNAIVGPEGSDAFEHHAQLHVQPRQVGELPAELKPPPPASRQTSWSTVATASESVLSFEAASCSNQSHHRMDSTSTVTYNLTSAFKQFRRIWCKHIRPLLKPLFGIPDEPTAATRKSAKLAGDRKPSITSVKRH